MKKTCLLFVFCFCYFVNSYSSDSIRNFLVLSNDKIFLDAYSVKYGRQISDNNWFKIGINLYGDYQTLDPQTSASYKRTINSSTYGIILGWDRQISTKMKNIDFLVGPNLRFNLKRDFFKIDNPTIKEDERKSVDNYYQMGLGFNFAFFYNLSDHFSFGSEINPNLVYYFSDEENSNNKTSGFGYRLNNVSISLRYMW